MKQPCINCARGFPQECQRKKKCVIEAPVAKVTHMTGERVHGGTADKLKDPKSTGRKRAALVYPLSPDSPCEWQGKRNCGGGKRPIIGCVDGTQKHRHHGPVKDTTRNHEGNVHRICTRCHNHWHELNDLIYDEKIYALLPHDPQVASAEELVKDELEWRGGQMGQRFELASSRNMLDTKHE